MKFRCIETHKRTFPLTLMFRALQVSSTGYYEWKDRDHDRRLREETRVIRIIEKIHQGSRYTYGSPRIHAYLTALGEHYSKSTVERLMRKYGIRAKTKRRFKATTNSKHKLPVADNVLDRNFSPTAPNQAWAGDITYIHTDEGWLYLAVVMDLYSRRIVGWAMQARMTKDLVNKALKMAYRTRQPGPGLVVHTDRGSQYCSGGYQALLRFFDSVPSMSRKANCWDNAVVESFFGSLKTEHVYFSKFKTREAAINSIFQWIEVYYNRERIHSTLGFCSPVKYESASKAA